MSNIDNVFGSIAAPMIKEWGQNVVYVGIADPGVYNPATGQVTQNESSAEIVSLNNLEDAAKKAVELSK